MTQNFSRNDLIQKYLNEGRRARDIDTALKQMGMGGYNPLTYAPNLQAIPGRLAKQGKALGRDLTTLGGAMVQSVASGFSDGSNIKDKFINAIQSEPLRRTALGAGAGAIAGSAIPIVGTVGGALLGGSAALLGGKRGIKEGGKDLVNAVLSTYNTNIDQIKSGDVDWRDIAQGIVDNPLYAGMDILSFGGAGALGKAGKAVAGKSGMLQKLLPGAEQAELNRRLTASKVWNAQNAAEVYSGYNKLLELPQASRSKIVENIVSNTGDLNAEEQLLANQLKLDLNKASKQLEEMGIFTPEFNKNNTIAQYVMNNVRKDTNLLHKDIMDILENRELRPTAAKMFEGNKLGDKVLNLIEEGNKLYDNGDIAFLSQKLASTVDPLGEVNARFLNLAEGNAPNYARIIGRAAPEEIGNVLEDTLKGQLDRSVSVKSAIDTFSDVINNDRLGVKLSAEQKAKHISAFRQSLQRDMRQGELPNFERALDNSSIDKVLKDAGKKYAFDSLKGFYRRGGNSVVERFSQKFKKNVLGVPSWSVGNRLGNWSMNAIEGVTAGDYGLVGKYRDLMPDALKLQSSYNSYLDLGSEILQPGAMEKVGKTIKHAFGPKSINKSITEFKKSYGRYKNSDRNLADKVNYIFDTVGDIGNVTASPVFELEAKMEYLDRAANYIRQAKRYAKQNKMKLEDVLKQSKTDKELFYQLNNNVNKSLGDYYGRNYAAPTWMQDALRLAVPFYRFPVQTARVTAHALSNPATAARFASNVTVPARAGNVLSNKYMNMFGLDKDNYTGGVPYYGNDGSLRTMGMMPTPLGIVLPRLTDPGAFAGMLNPLFSGNIIDMLQYKKFDKTPSSPRYSEMKLINPQEALNYKPTGSERLGFALNEILGTTYNPYIWATRIAPPIASLAKGEGRTPFYNTMQPIRYKMDANNRKVYEFEPGFDQLKSPVEFQLQNIEGYQKRTPIELLGGNVGLSTKTAYQRRGGQNQTKEIKKLVKKTRKNVEKNRGK